jgi:hypothetical protein
MPATQMMHIRLTKRDRQRIDMIRDDHGCVSDAAAVRKALELAETAAQVSPPQKTTRSPSTKGGDA